MSEVCAVKWNGCNVEEIKELIDENITDINIEADFELVIRTSNNVLHLALDNWLVKKRSVYFGLNDYLFKKIYEEDYYE